MLRCEARDEGRSLVYDAEERNEADGHFVVQTPRGAAFRAICFVVPASHGALPHMSLHCNCVVACLAKGVYPSLRPASRMQRRSAARGAPAGGSGSGGEHGLALALTALLRLAPLRTCRGATLREPSRN